MEVLTRGQVVSHTGNPTKVVQAVRISWKCTDSDAAIADSIRSCKAEDPMTLMLM